MSLDATIWAWKIKFNAQKGKALPSLKKMILLSMADRADENHCCYPSVQRLSDDCQMDRKTALKIIDELIEDGFIIDTGERKGKTKQVIVYRLNGVAGREDTLPTVGQFGSENSKPNNPNNGTVPTVEQFQQSDETVPTIPPNSPNVGTRNLPSNLPEESKNKKHWLCCKKLSLEISQANEEINPNDIINATWFNREFRAFELFNAENNLCDELMIYHFANRLLDAKTRYDGLKQPRSYSAKGKGEPKSTTLTDKQIRFLASKLSRLHDFSKYAVGNESHEQLAQRLEPMLRDPKKLKEWAEYLTEIGFEQKGNAA